MVDDRPKIDVRIAYDLDGMLGREYNDLMLESPHDWVLFIDHDVFLCNPHWYHICTEIVKSASPDVGMFTCYTNNIGNRQQRHTQAPKSLNLAEHIDFARQVFDKEGYSTNRIGPVISGMFMLIRKEAWEDVGGCPGIGFFREDGEFGRALKREGWSILRMNGLYVFHLRNRKSESWIEGQKISKDYV